MDSGCCKVTHKIHIRYPWGRLLDTVHVLQQDRSESLTAPRMVSSNFESCPICDSELETWYVNGDIL